MPVTVPTDSFQIARPPSFPGVAPFLKQSFSSLNSWFSGATIIATVPVYPGPTTFIEGVNASLQSCGWSSIGLFGSGVINMTLYGGGILQPFYFNNTIFTGRKQQYIGINPGGFTPFQMLEALVIDLNVHWGDIYIFSAALDSSNRQIIIVKAAIPGSVPNQPQVEVAAGVAFGYGGNPNPSVCSGGGYSLTSLLANNKTGLTVTLVSGLTAQVDFTFQLTTMGSATPQYSVFFGSLGTGSIIPAGVIPPGGVQPNYTFICDPYQFVVVDDANTIDFTGGFNYGGNSLFACAPFVNLITMPTLGTSAFIVGPGMLKNQMTWNSGGSSSYAVNGDFITFQGLFESANGLSTFIYPFAYPVLTSNNKPLTINPYVVAAPNLATESTVIGQVWDAIILTQAGFLPGAEQIINGNFCHLISQQIGLEPCSLWVAFA